MPVAYLRLHSGGLRRPVPRNQARTLHHLLASRDSNIPHRCNSESQACSPSTQSA